MATGQEWEVFAGSTPKYFDTQKEAFQFAKIYSISTRTKVFVAQGGVDVAVFDFGKKKTLKKASERHAMELSDDMFKKVLRGYLEAALFTATAGEDDPSGLDDGDQLDKKYSVTDFDDSSVKKAAKVVEKFLNKPGVWDAIGEVSPGLTEVGADLWYTSNGHGVGFWDGDYGDDSPGTPADVLTKASKGLGGEGYVTAEDEETLHLEIM